MVEPQLSGSVSEKSSQYDGYATYLPYLWSDAERVWEREPDRLDWVDDATGYGCYLFRNSHHGYLSGFVDVPEGHPAFGESATDLATAFEVHNGVSFAFEFTPANLFRGARVWRIGFDCCGRGDLPPYARFMAPREPLYRSVDFVKQECAHLAKQLHEAHLSKTA